MGMAPTLLLLGPVVAVVVEEHVWADGPGKGAWWPWAGVGGVQATMSSIWDCLASCQFRLDVSVGEFLQPVCSRNTGSVV